jgi:putative FmdB family regulatory protein
MPVYEYRCQECGKAFEQLRRMSDTDRDLRCPFCGAPQVERVLSSFATGGNSAGGGCATPSRGRFR